MNASSWTAQLRSPAELQRLLVQWGPKLAIGAVTLALAAEAAVVITRQVPSVPPPSAEEAQAAAPSRPVRRNNASDIISAHLFGSAESDGNAPRTNVQLVLAGVLAGDDPAKGSAIIGPASTSVKLYATGQALPGGTKLNAVYNDRVLIENNGALEALYLPRISAAASVAPKAAAPTGGQRLQTALQNNASLLNGAIRLQAVFSQGKLSGYRVFPGRGGAEALSKLGLRAGDLITAVNGTQLDDASRAAEILQTLSSADSATVTLTRNGASEDLTLNLSEVASAAENAASGSSEADDGSTADSGQGRPPGGGRLQGGRPGGPRGAGNGSDTQSPAN
ncbi:MAG: type II secretion system protein GspC [Steroidobacteraceae bacterium]